MIRIYKGVATILKQKHRTMKANIVILIIFFLFDSLKGSSLDIQVQKIVKIESKNDKVELYSATINIFNNTDRIICFWAMTCSWQENWIFSNDSFGLVGELACDSNFPDLIELKPNQSKKYECKIVRNRNVKNINTKDYKIGFVLIKENTIMHDTFREVLKDKINKRKDIIWSVPFELY